MPIRVLERTVGPYDVVGAADFLVDRQLRRDALARFGLGDVVALDDAPYLRLRLARGHDDLVVFAVPTGLEQQRNIGDGEWVARRVEAAEPGIRLRSDKRVNDAL